MLVDYLVGMLTGSKPVVVGWKRTREGIWESAQSTFPHASSRDGPIGYSFFARAELFRKFPVIRQGGFDGVCSNDHLRRNSAISIPAIPFARCTTSRCGVLEIVDTSLRWLNCRIVHVHLEKSAVTE